MSGIDKCTPLAQARVRRNVHVHGLVTPAFVRGFDYSITRLAVYADGLTDVFSLLDQGLFAEKVRTGSVVPSVPDGARLATYHFGAWVIDNGSWEFAHGAGREDFVARIRGLLRQLNPEMRNLYELAGDLRKSAGGVRADVLPTATPIRGVAGYADRTGDSLFVLCRRGD